MISSKFADVGSHDKKMEVSQVAPVVGDDDEHFDLEINLSAMQNC